MVEMIWKEPPPAVSSEKAAVLAELKKNPGKWALVQRAMASSSATAPWSKLGCEAVYRKSEDQPKKFDIYARWPERKVNGVGGHPMPESLAVSQAKARQSGGVYDPARRDARGVPSNGLSVESLRR